MDHAPPTSARRPLPYRLALWTPVWLFWAIVSRNNQATTTLLVIATTALVGGAAAVVEIDFWLRRRLAGWPYAAAIIGLLLAMTIVVVSLITVSYNLLLGPGPAAILALGEPWIGLYFPHDSLGDRPHRDRLLAAIGFQNTNGPDPPIRAIGHYLKGAALLPGFTVVRRAPQLPSTTSPP